MVKKEFITISFSVCIKLKLFIEYFISFNMDAPINFDSDLYLVKANIIIVGRYKEIDNIKNISIGKLFFRTKNINGYEITEVEKINYFHGVYIIFLRLTRLFQAKLLVAWDIKGNLIQCLHITFDCLHGIIHSVRDR